jgi:hypothetical protein
MECQLNKFGKVWTRFFAVVQILALTLLAACATVGGVTSTNVCHATGDPQDPYEEIKVTPVELKEHRGHLNDIDPVPVGGCPASPVAINDGRITICHATGSETNPYNEIIVSVNGLNGHGTHEDDLIPAPEEGCPAIPIAGGNDKITICHATGSEKNPYNEITVSVNGLNGHDQHEGDIIPAPAGGCPTTK